MRKPIALMIALTIALCTSAMATDWYASEVVDSYRLGNSPYDDPLATLGKPSTWMNNSGAPGDTDPCAVMMICPAWNVGLSGEKLITTIKSKSSSYAAGYIIVKFDTPVYDDPDNWYGKDFIVFGNPFFVLGGSYVYSGSNMEDMMLSAYGGSAMWVEPSPVEVSQDGITWYTFSNGPYADDYAPTHAFAWDWVENHWLTNSSGVEIGLDFTRPVDPAWTESSFASISCAQAIDMYEGSGGGTPFDLAELPDYSSLATDPVTGMKWIQYIKVDGVGGEVDAFARVSHMIEPMSIGEAKKLDDGSHVVLDDVVVSAATYTVGRYCYVQQENRSSGIKVMGRVLDIGAKINLMGDIDTIDGERVIQATSVLAVTDAETADVKPLGMPNKAIGNFGLSTTGLLVKTWGTVKSIDSETKSFVIDDGSGCDIKCIAPRSTDDNDESNWGSIVDADFTAPEVDAFVTVTGISSTEEGGETYVIRLRSCDDVQ
ncbi:hypothetical protein LLG46_02885 [bacterium]|nr:hypothetical protein [bacterium]